MIGGKIKCMNNGYYRVVMDDGKLFTVVHHFNINWRVYADKESSPEMLMGEFKTLKKAKQAIVDDFRHREFPDHKLVWYGTKWGLIYENGQLKGVWRGQKPEGWTFNFFLD